MLLGLALAALVWLHQTESSRSDEPIGLFGSVPLMWSESDGLSLQAPVPWPRPVIESRGKPVPLDTLTLQPGPASLAGLKRLVLAQPRALSPDEMFALDQWVRQGGRLLLLVDPAWTGESRFALGDPRRPQSIAMISPLLNHWGLDLQFDPDQAEGERQASVMGTALPVDMPGRFALRGGNGCRLWDEGLVATCAIGTGRVLLLADSAVLDTGQGEGGRTRALKGLLDAAFAVR